MDRKDPKGYYSLLGVLPSASFEEIKKAYRVKAMELHPDRNPGRNTTDAFQQLQEAYEVIGNPYNREQYDSFALSRAEEPEPQGQIEPIVCSKCGCVSAQPRYAIFFEVKSFIFSSHKSARQGIFCADCASKVAFKASLITWFLGWWGIPWGPIWSVEAIFKNMFGGTRPPEHNARILFYQAAYFASKGQNDLARAIAFDALNLSLKIKETKTTILRRKLGYDANESAALLVEQIKQFLHALDDKLPFKKLKPQWGIFNRILYQQAGLAFAVIIGVQIASSFDDSTSSRSVAPPPIDTTKYTYVPPIATFNHPEEPLPESKIFERYTKIYKYEPLPPFKISSSATGTHCLLKLYDSITNVPALSIFLRAGDETKVSVPVGIYKVRLACGIHWYGEKYLFGPNTSYSELDSLMNFKVQGNELSGEEIKLIPQINGNLTRTRISAAQF